MARSRAGRVDQVEEQGRSEIDLDASAWLVQIAVPDRPGSMELSYTTPRALQEWINRVDDGPSDGRPHYLRPGPIDVRTRKRRVTVAWGGVYSELHVDGSSFLASPIGWGQGPAGTWEYGPTGVLIDDELLATTLLAQTRIAAAHAVENAHTGGDVLVRVRIVGGVTYEGNRIEGEKILVHQRHHSPQQLPNTTRIVTAETEATLTLEDLYIHGAGWVSAASAVMKDLVQAFGLAEPYQFTETGEVRTNYFSNRAAWAQDMGLGQSEEILR